MLLHFIFSLALLFSSAFGNHDGKHHHLKEHSNDQTSLLVELSGIKYNLTWCADFDSQEITFKVDFIEPKQLDDDRWLMFGFSDHGKLAGSDFCLFNNGGNGTLIDGYLGDKLEPKIDVHQDCNFIAYDRHNGHLDGYLGDKLEPKIDVHQDCNFIAYDRHNGHLVFRRKFTTCDIRDYAVEPGTTQFLLATGHGEFKSLLDKHVSYHLRYNMLLQYPVKFPGDDSDAKTMKILAKDAPVPAEQTTYWCAIVKLDENLQNLKHHIVKLEPVISEGLEQIVHHMVLYHCAMEQDASEVYNGKCQADERPEMSHLCSKVMAAWSMGASTVFYPKEAGLPFGGKGFVPLVMVEIHYNNPGLKSGLIDNSGFKITYTPHLRPHDAG
uniref:DOMON domain-containing protein n=1 Tax=Panagrolaimus sp. ES5 TaxID=591445 RepID=A0AC34G4B1_9BILA